MTSWVRNFQVGLTKIFVEVDRDDRTWLLLHLGENLVQEVESQQATNHNEVEEDEEDV